MYPRALLACALILACLNGRAQSYTVRGTVSDTFNARVMPFASVSLIRTSDSVLNTFTRAGQDGSFTLHPDSAGRYLLLITASGFADYTDVVKVPNTNPVELGTIAMLTKEHLLEEVVVKRKLAAIVIKGDTTEFAADSFAVREGATVDELLKKLPGLQVDKDGKVTAQGQTVQKILVDGEEFFSDDPAVVTKNLQSKAVDKVQVFDKKSDNAEFTGIDDGEKIKTINLQLKENFKKGYFGKVALGGGNDGYFENQAMLNAFKGKRQVSAFGIMSNTGRVGLGWEDRDKYGSGSNGQYDEESGNTYYTSSGDEDGGFGGTYSGEGLPKVWTGGLHYADKWDQDNQHLVGNYRGAKQNIETVGGTLTQYTLPGDSQYFNSQNRNVFKTGTRHRADGMYEWKTDSSSTLRITADAARSDNQSITTSETKSLRADGSLINNSNRRLTNDATSQSINATLSWRKKFKKAGRNLSFSFNETYRENESVGFLMNRNQYFTNGTSDTTDQRKNSSGRTLGLSGRLSYTEPLSKVTFLEVNYALNSSNSNSTRLSFDKTGAVEEYESLNMRFSSDYVFNVMTHTGGSNLRFVYKKVNFSFGGAVGQTHFDQRDKLRDTSFVRDYTNFFPKASFSFKPNKQASISLNYNGSTNQPTISQIQPIQENTDPLNISIGNPNLKQEFNHSLRLNYNSYKVLSGAYNYFGGGMNFTQNDISRTETVDGEGRRTYQYVNVNGNSNGYIYGGRGMQIKKYNIRLDLRGNLNTSRNKNFVNGVLNTSNNNSYGIGVGFDKTFKKGDKDIASFNFSPNFSYNDNNATISNLATSYWSSESTAEGSVELPGKIRLVSSVWFNIRQRTAIFDKNNNVIRWDAYVAKKLLKGDQLEIRASVFDMLNQNRGFQRYGQSNAITENTYNTIRRYGLISAVWNFTKSPVSNSQ